jgi:hypothetical protein
MEMLSTIQQRVVETREGPGRLLQQLSSLADDPPAPPGVGAHRHRDDIGFDWAHDSRFGMETSWVVVKDHAPRRGTDTLHEGGLL